jgi:hypothetical protein
MDAVTSPSCNTVWQPCSPTTNFSRRALLSAETEELIKLMTQCSCVTLHKSTVTLLSRNSLLRLLAVVTKLHFPKADGTFTGSFQYCLLTYSKFSEVFRHLRVFRPIVCVPFSSSRLYYIIVSLSSLPYLFILTYLRSWTLLEKPPVV